MKKLLLFFGLLMMSFSMMYGQNAADEPTPWSDHPDLNGYTVQFRAIDATCYNNGQVEFYIADANGNPIDSLTLVSLRLSEFNIKYRGVVLDTTPQHKPVQYTFPKTRVQMETGDFEIYLQCLHEESDHSFTAIEEQTELTVELDYTVPVISPLTVRSNDGVMLGNIPSLECDSTGRVQVCVTGGRFPYTFAVVDHNNPLDTLRTVVFDTNQRFGTVDSQMDYLNYYTFEEMPSGEWDFYLEDGCGYEMPRASVIVDQIAPPKLDSIGVYASSGNIADNNRLKIKVYLGNDFTYYLQMFQPDMEYRFLIPTIGDNGETVSLTDDSWIQFPTTTSSEVTLAMDAIRADDYCSIWDKDIVFQLKLGENHFCEPYIMSDTFHYHKPDSAHFVTENGFTIISQTDPGNCGSGTTLRHTDHFSIRYDPYHPNYVNPHDDHDYIRYHFTYPIVWVYTTPAGDEIKRDTITSSIAQKSYINLSDFPGDTTTLPFETTYNMHLFDAHGCELFKGSRQIKVTTNTSTDNAKWRTSQVSTKCCKDGNPPRSITLFEEFGSDNLDYDGLTVELIASPNSNMYNFEAIYHSTTHSWTVNKTMELANLAVIGGTPDGKSVTMTEQCLPSGNYVFQITNMPCVAGAAASTALLPGYITVREEVAPAFSIVNNCSNKFIKFTEGKIIRDYKYRNSNNVLKTDSVELPIQFRLVGGPVGGYDPNDNTVYTIGDSVLISMPTDSLHPYIIKTTVDDSQYPLCEPYVRYDTIFYNGSTVMFDFALAFLCKATDTIGTAYVRAWNGNPPYRYQLYSHPDLAGTLIGDTTLGANEVATFPNRVMETSRQLSCRVEDACGAAFKLNFPPQTMSEIQKTWFDGGLSAITTCEGSTITVHVLRVGDVFKYAWYKNNDTIPFTTTSEPGLFVPRHADTAVYHVKIFQTGCSEFIEDSVTIYPKKSPWVDISPMDSVCPGQDAVVSFTPHAVWGNTVSFAIAFETRDVKDVRVYDSIPSGTVVTDTFRVNSEAKVYPYYVNDEECGYPVADPGDTIYIHVSSKVINPCQIITENDAVCYGEDALLTASCTENAPLTIRWYSDFEMTDLLDTFLVETTGAVSNHPLNQLRERTVRYVSVYKEGWCPSVNNSPNNVVNMTSDSTTLLRCTDSYLFFDNGGPDGDYAAGQDVANSMQVFINMDSVPLTIHFDSLELSSTSHLFLFSSTMPITSNLFYELNSYSTVPDIIVSPNDTLMVYFVPGDLPAWGWRATVQPSPGIAIADVMLPEVTHYYDKVCQRSDGVYDNQQILSLNIVDQDTLAAARTKAGTYIYSKVDTTSMGCDSTTTLTFMVSSPPMREELAVTTSEIGYDWNGHLYNKAGVYAVNIPDEQGCDFLNVLNLIVIEVTNEDKDVCYGESTVIGLELVTNDSVKPMSPLIDERHVVGDVLCRKGNMYEVMRPDEFIDSGIDSGWVAYGVVVFVDPNDNSHGRAIALVDATDEKYVLWSKANYNTLIHAEGMKGDWLSQRTDMEGSQNTKHIWSDAQTIILNSSETFKEIAPAAYYCYYYDPELQEVGGVHNGWYLPSAGEWYMCFAYRVVINNTLTKLSTVGARTLTGGTDDNYWTSTEVNKDKASCVNGKGQLIQHLNKSDATHVFRVRAMIAY